MAGDKNRPDRRPIALTDFLYLSGWRRRKAEEREAHVNNESLQQQDVREQLTEQSSYREK